MPERQFPVHRDVRGELVVVDGADVAFPIQRVFTVSGADGAPSRGGHLTGCTELIVLIAGSAVFNVRRPGRREAAHHLTEPGQSLTLEAEDHIDYTLGGSDSVILVVCDAPFRSER